MTDSPLHFAIRETQDLIRRRTAWVIMPAIGLVLGIAGPFGTEDEMRLVPRVAYWVVVVVVTFLIGNFTGALADRLLRSRTWPRVLRILVTGVLIGCAVVIVILLMNWAIFGLSPAAPGYAPALALNTIAVSIIITGALDALGPTSDSSKPAPDSEAPRLLKRLPFEKRGQLISLSVADHYVAVTTTNGTEDVLMRLSDAMDEATPEAGLQVHRSHWVALSAITAVNRDGARAVLTLSNGTDIPASRSFIPALKEAGLLPA